MGPIPHAPSRRNLFAAALLPVIAAPALAAITEPAPSSLARACAWAHREHAKRDVEAFVADWSEDRWEAELAATQAVVARAIAEPSASVSDLAAKARLLLADMERMNRLGGEEPDALDRLNAVVLREIIALGAV